MFKISVIVPFYNVERYIGCCIEHIINQSIGFKKNVQLILVDDNSTDSSYKIALKYAEQYPENVILKKLKKCSGSGGKPRNVGIKLATSEYIMFSDADDFFSNEALEIMYNVIKEKKAEIIVSNWQYTDINGKPWEKPVFNTKELKSFRINIKNGFKSFYVMNSSMCNKIFKKSFIEKNDILCLEDIPGEDTYFSMKAFLCAKDMYYIDDITYYYRQRNTSAKMASTSWKGSKKYFDGINNAYKKIYELFVEKDQIQFYRFLYARNCAYLLYKLIDSKSLTDSERKILLSELRWYFEIGKKLKVSFSQKSIDILIDYIIEEKYCDAINICKIISEMREYILPEIRGNMYKPSDEIYEEILKVKT